MNCCETQNEAPRHALHNADTLRPGPVEELMEPIEVVGILAQRLLPSVLEDGRLVNLLAQLAAYKAMRDIAIRQWSRAGGHFGHSLAMDVAKAQCVINNLHRDIGEIVGGHACLETVEVIQ